jgi:LysM repeat protein
MKFFVVALAFLILNLSAFSQAKMTREQYISKYKNVAINNMRKHKVPASITLAQGLLESGNGNSELSQKSNNHFGIKCHSTWKGKKTYHDDDKKKECFRVYKTVEDSYADHANFLHKSRYAKCFELKITDYKGWAKELKNAGYATNPKYPKLLIKIIEDNELYKYDEEALGRKASKEPKETVKTPTGNASGSKGPNEKYDNNKEFEDVDYYGKPMVKLSENKIKFIIAGKGDSPEKIARKMEMGRWQILLYNNVKPEYRFREGEKIYLQPKRNKGSKPYHIAKSGESIWIISQKFGVKMSKIRKYNKLTKDSQIKPGQKIYLKRP